jgi:hypothetical protein
VTVTLSPFATVALRFSRTQVGELTGDLKHQDWDHVASDLNELDINIAFVEYDIDMRILIPSCAWAMAS